MICTAEGCGAGFAVAAIAISIAAYNIARIYFKYKNGEKIGNDE